MRIAIGYQESISDARAARVLRRLTAAGVPATGVRVIDVYTAADLSSSGLSHERLTELFLDHVAQQPLDQEQPAASTWDVLIEIAYRPGVTDPVALTAQQAIEAEAGAPLAPSAGLCSARLYAVSGVSPDQGKAAALVLHNPLIELATVITRAQYLAGVRLPDHYAAAPAGTATPTPGVARFDLAALSDAQLEALSAERLLALSLAEMQAIRAYQQREAGARAAAGVDPRLTDVELEMIAQTWSEHCKHKIFAACVDYQDEHGRRSEIDGLFRTYIKATTDRLAAQRPFLRSVFHDNSGVIAFDEETLVCFKAETHNSPSALDPYGGAITGIVGVNRDIMGTGKGARPIFNTNVLCFGYPDTPSERLSPGLLPPARVMDGVHRGIVDGGNQSGIPVVAGGFLFDESYLGKPLVFCGTGGILPAQITGEPAESKAVLPGDLAVMVGGRIGKDGIHGATFSSLALDETSPTSAVQIGDPIIQRRMLDFLLVARDAGLYRGITDNGAGGLSSSLGEMAEEPGGIEIDLDACPLKYPGLEPWEILLSESQERMSLAVAPEHAKALLALAAQMDVEATVVGRFTNSGIIRATAGGHVVAHLSIDFLHNGVPQMHIPATWTPGRAYSSAPAAADPSALPAALHGALPALLADANIGNKEHLVRQYDHEVQGGSVVKPFQGRCADGPSDGAVITPRFDSDRGLTVTHGICPRYGDIDTYHMAACAVDEALRAHVALGGDPDQAAALDNFCWPDPVESASTPDGRYKMAQLVRACQGLADTCTAYAVPLISGKDSMKNDARMGGRKVSIRPTLLVSLMGIIPDVRASLGTDFLHPGDVVLLAGAFCPRLGGSSAERVLGLTEAECPVVDSATNLAVYRGLHRAASDRLIHTCHDLSDGGLAVALAECVIGGRLGARVTTAPLAGAEGDTAAPDATQRLLYGETAGCFLLSCAPAELPELTARFPAGTIVRLGEVTNRPVLEVITPAGELRWSLEELLAAWNAFGRESGLPSAGTVRTTAAPNAAHAAGGGEPAAPGIRHRPRVIVAGGYGINADRELAEAFSRAGADAELVHLSRLYQDPGMLEAAAVVALPGGFSYGDHLGSGLVLSHLIRTRLGDALARFCECGRLVLGICNGFQVLTKAGLLPGGIGSPQTATLVHNESALFEDSWVTLAPESSNPSPWLVGLEPFDCPIRHGEGRFVAPQVVVDQLSGGGSAADSTPGRVAFRYVGRNPNGSVGGIAGVTSQSGTILGLMPHPEAFLRPENHPHARTGSHHPPLHLFRNAVEFSTL